MKAALIPPIPHLYAFAEDERFHLVLSHLLSDRAYAAFYRDMRLRGSYLVLDNGAHENKAGEAMRDLLTKAKALRANEVVLPDTLFEAQATIDGAQAALNFLIGEGADMFGEQVLPRLMLVPQGRTLEQWERCLQEMLQAYMEAWVARRDVIHQYPVIGVSKDYDFFHHGHLGLLENLAALRDWMKFDVHLLGWARDLRDLAFFARRFPWIRSTDSAKPFVYAMSGIVLRTGTTPEYPTRPKDYFDRKMTAGQQVVASGNVRVFKEAANAPREL